jgi:hypothetical protein
MTEHDPIEQSLAERLSRAESRVPAGGPPDAARAADGRWGMRRAALVAATAVAAVVLSVAVVDRLPADLIGNASPSPQPEVYEETQQGDFLFSASAARATWEAGEPVTVTATLVFLGEGETMIWGGGGPMQFEFRQLSGGERLISGGQRLPCVTYPITAGEPLVRDRTVPVPSELPLEAGRWRVTASIPFDQSGCGGERRYMEVMLEIEITEGEAPTAAPTATAEPSVQPITDMPGLLAVSRDGDVWLRRADGSGLRQLTDDPNLDERPLSWLADGSRLAITRTPNDDPYAASTLALLDPESGELTELGTVQLTYSIPSRSPDGTRIAFGGDGDPSSPGIAILDLVDGSFTQLTDDGGHGYDAVNGPIWSPDGSQIAYQAYDGASNDVLIVRVADGTVTSPAPDPSDDYPLRWVDVDGTLKLLFGSFRGTNEDKFDARPWIVNVDGSELQLLDGSGIVTSADPQPTTWTSPDGRWIVSSCDAGVCIANAAGDDPLYAIPNTEGWTPHEISLSWVQGGEYVVYSRFDLRDRSVVMALPLPNGDPIVLTADGASEGSPAWQPTPGG